MRCSLSLVLAALACAASPDALLAQPTGLGLTRSQYDLVYRHAYYADATRNAESEWGNARTAHFRRQADGLQAQLDQRNRALARERAAGRRNRRRIVQLEREADRLNAQISQIAQAATAELARIDQGYRRTLAQLISEGEQLLRTDAGRRALELIAAGGRNNRAQAANLVSQELVAQDEAATRADRLRRASRYREAAYLNLEIRWSGGLTTTANLIRLFEEAVTNDPSRSRDWVELARLYRDSLDLAGSARAADAALRAAATDQERSTALVELGEVLLAQGRSEQARNLYEQAFELDQRLAAAGDGGAESRDLLAVTFDRLGDFYLGRGDHEAALARYTYALEIRRSLLAAEPASPRRQRAVVVSLNRIGFVHLRSGRLDAAQSHYSQGLQMAEDLAARDSSLAGAQADLAIGLDRMGDLLMARGNAAEAAAFYRRSSAIWRQLLELDPALAGFRRTLVLNLIRRADAIAEAPGATDEAGRRARAGEVLTALRAALEQMDAIATIAPATPALERDMSVLLQRMGDQLFALEDRNGAIDYFRRGLDVDMRLAAANPDAARHQRDIAVSLVRLAEMQADGFTWTRAAAQFEQMARRGMIEPADEPIVAEVRRRAGAESPQ